MAKTTGTGYHEQVSAAKVAGAGTGPTFIDQFVYRFENFFHPFVDGLISQMNAAEAKHAKDPKSPKDPLAAILNASWQQTLKRDSFDATYHPNPSHDPRIAVSGEPLQIDTDEHGSYSAYNWELFYHIPLTIAVHLSKTRRYAEAMRWFHFVFNPTATDKSVDPPKRFWNFIGFRNDLDPKQIDYLLALLSADVASLSPDDKQRRDDIQAGYDAILDKPFMPHAVARTRHIAYQYSVVMKYLDNLIAWGDDLFQQYTVETINEATQLYVLAANILGPRPEKVPASGTIQPKTFFEIRTGLDEMSNTLVSLENAFPFNAGSTGPGSPDASGAGPLFGIARTLYFCIPKNDKLLGYWDLVADRLFKIRHCMNIQGVVQPLPLFDPPIDPGLLVAAAAAGIDISSIVSGLNQPVGPLRSLPLIQKTLELCNEVRSFGAALLVAIEKGDGEHLLALREAHEYQIQQKTEEVRFYQRRQAEETTNSLLTARRAISERLQYYKRVLGLPADPNLDPEPSIDRQDTTEDNFDDLYQKLVEKYDKQVARQDLPPLSIAGSSSPSQQAGAAGPGNLYLNANEDVELNRQMPAALSDMRTAFALDPAAVVALGLPNSEVNMQYMGVGGTLLLVGGRELCDMAKLMADTFRRSAEIEKDEGALAGRTAGYQRRADEWILQHNLAAHDMMQNGRQILTSLIAEQIARHEQYLAQSQVANAKEVNDFLQQKFTTEELYTWMQGELSRLFYQYYRFAFDTARKAEQTMKRELMRPEVDSQTFVQFNYWDSGRRGLLAGEALHLDVKRMEMAYHDNNKRELELTKHVSLRQLDPLQLLRLRVNGTCQVTIPEWLFDKDCPGHYMRRIKTVALSVPSVAGPYTGVHCTLTLLSSSIRRSPLLSRGEYLRQDTEDNRFLDYAGAAQSIVTSSGSNDSGMFDADPRDERFLPFEGAGAISTWKLELPTAFPAFDRSTISDVILHIRYTARQGLDFLVVSAALMPLFSPTSDGSGTDFGLFFSLAHDFPTEWSSFTNGATPLNVAIKRDYFPYFVQGYTLNISDLHIYSEDLSPHHSVGDTAAASNDLKDGGMYRLTVAEEKPPAVPAPVLVRDARDVFLIIRYTIQSRGGENR